MNEETAPNNCALKKFIQKAIFWARVDAEAQVLPVQKKRHFILYRDKHMPEGIEPILPSKYIIRARTSRVHFDFSRPEV